MSLKNYPSFLLNFSQGEMDDKNGCIYTFKTFRLNLAERELWNGDTKLSLTPKAFDVLAILVERAGHLVEKDDLMRLAWPDAFVEEANLARIVHMLRRTLGENGGDKFIETVARKGYRFVVPVTIHGQPEQKILIDNQNLDGEADLQIPAMSVAELINKPKRRRRYILLTAGFLGAVVLVFLLFNFQSGGPKNFARRFTTNEEASRLYLLGAALANKSGRKNADKAVEYFTQAIELDANYAPAYAGIASAHTSMAITAGGDTHEQYIKAKTAIEKALALDNDLAEAHSALGDLKWSCEWDFTGAETAHKRAA